MASEPYIVSIDTGIEEEQACAGEKVSQSFASYEAHPYSFIDTHGGDGGLAGELSKV